MILDWLKTRLKAVSETPLFLKISPKPIGRRLVIPDIHGCILTLEALIRRLDLKQEDQLFFLGDYINKGPDSRAVLDYLMDLATKFSDVHFLKGNHEDGLLRSHYRGTKALKQYVKDYQSENLLTNDHILEKYVKFLESLAYYIDTGNYYLVHAGFNFSARQPLKDFDAMLFIRDYPIDKEFLGDRRIVHGHNPQDLNIIKNHIQEFSPVIPLDNGCVYALQREGQGNLLCFDLDTQELTIQQNIDGL